MDTPETTRQWVYWVSDKNPNDAIWRGKSFNCSRWHLIARFDQDRTECGLNVYSAESNTHPTFAPFLPGEGPPEVLRFDRPIRTCAHCRKRANR